MVAHDFHDIDQSGGVASLHYLGQKVSPDKLDQNVAVLDPRMAPDDLHCLVATLKQVAVIEPPFAPEVRRFKDNVATHRIAIIPETLDDIVSDTRFSRNPLGAGVDGAGG